MEGLDPVAPSRQFWPLLQSYTSQVLMSVSKKCSPKPFGQTKNGLVSGRLACTSSKTDWYIKQNRNLDFNPEFSS